MLLPGEKVEADGIYRNVHGVRTYVQSMGAY